MKFKNRMIRFAKEKIFDGESFWHSFDIWNLKFGFD